MRSRLCLQLRVLWPFLLLTSAPAWPAEGRLALTLPSTRPEAFERVEIIVDGVPAAANPFDPDSVALDLEVLLPSGKKLSLPGFFHRDFERKLEGDREVLTARGEGAWRFRWLPLGAGRHTLTATATVGGKPAARGEAAIEVVAGKRRGLIGVEPRERRHYQFDDGTPLFLNGLCACWHGKRGTYDYHDWLPAYQKAGINYIRLWMWPEAFGIEWDRGDRLQYASTTRGGWVASSPRRNATGSWS